MGTVLARPWHDGGLRDYYGARGPPRAVRADARALCFAVANAAAKAAAASDAVAAPDAAPTRRANRRARQVFNSYGWDARHQLQAWGPLALASFVAFGVAPPLIARVPWLKLVVFSIAVFYIWTSVCGDPSRRMQAAAAAHCSPRTARRAPRNTHCGRRGLDRRTDSFLFTVHVADLTTPVPTWSFYTGMLNVPFSTTTMLISASVVATKLPTHAQVAANALTQIAGQAGRGVGPILVTTWYEWFIGVRAAPTLRQLRPPRALTGPSTALAPARAERPTLASLPSQIFGEAGGYLPWRASCDTPCCGRGRAVAVARDARAVKPIWSTALPSAGTTARPSS